jgi:hypothetical protein
MAVIVSGPLDKPVVTPTLADGGSLEPNTTYYVKVMATGGGSYPNDLRNPSRSRVSDEVSFTTTAVKLSCDLAWTIPAGATNYWVYVTKVSGSYSNKVQQLYYSGLSVNSYSLTAISNQVNYCIIWSRDSAIMPSGIDKMSGRLLVSFDAATTLQDIYDQIVADGYGNNVFYDGYTFVLFGSIFMEHGGTMTELNKTIMFLEGSFGTKWQDVGQEITLGEWDAAKKAGTNGCVIYFPLMMGHNGRWTHGTINYYGCTIKGGVPNFPDGSYFYSSYYSTVRLNGVRFDKMGPAVNAGRVAKEVSGFVIHGASVALQSGAVGRDLTINGGQLTFHSGTPTAYDVVIVNGTGSGYGGVDILIHLVPSPLRLYDVTAPDRADNLPTLWCAQNDYMELYYGLDLTVVDENNTPISGATVQIVDVDGNPVSGSPFTTDADGKITADTYLLGYERGRNAAGSGNYDYQTAHTPHTITISKANYRTHTLVLTMDRKREEIETLEALDVTAPVFAGLVSATNCQTSGEVELAWAAASDAGTGVAGYNIYYHTENDAAAIVAQGVRQVAAAGATVATVGGLTDGTLYYFIVRAYDAECPSNEDTNEVIESARPSPGTPIEEMITCNVLEDVITGNIIEDQIVGDMSD